LIGWVAAGRSIDLEAATLFGVVFIWQIPHFLAIAWLYREDYANGGFCMLPAVDPRGTLTANLMVTYCVTLLPVSLLPYLQGSAGLFYLFGAAVLGTAFVVSSWRFARQVSDGQARRVLRASLIYLPALLAALLVDGWIGSLHR
jgi:protoheme IX farnesyltransferase